MSWQGSLFDSEDGPALSFDGLVRHRLDERSWIDEVPGWAPGHAVVFDELLQVAPWQQRERWMYERKVLEPRMVAGWPTAEDLPHSLEEMRQAVSDRYRVEFDSVHVNLYRDGRDGVAWHGDRNRHTLTNPLVVTISLGEHRRFLLRPGTSGTPTRFFRPGGGDLIVMGGACQHEWQHMVPKEPKGAGARMSVTMRHSREGHWAR